MRNENGGQKMYQNFEYYTPTKVIFGKETELRTGELIRDREYHGLD